MKNLHIKSTGCYGNSFRLFTKKPNGNHEEVTLGTGTLNGQRVAVKVEGETLKFDSPIEAIKRASAEGYALVGV